MKTRMLLAAILSMWCVAAGAQRFPGRTDVVSVAFDGGPASNDSCCRAAISADGRFVAFMSGAANLVADDTNGVNDIFVRDRHSGLTERVSVASDGTEASAPFHGSFDPVISADGRFVAFGSYASNLVAGDSNGVFDLFVRDRQTGTTELVSGGNGVPANGHSFFADISADGRFVAFVSFASNLVAEDTNGVPDVFVRDRLSGVTVRASVGPDGAQGNYGSCCDAAISGDGRFVAFASSASNLVAGDTGTLDIFVRDLQTGLTERVSEGRGGVESNGWSAHPSISADGRVVAFWSGASNLVERDLNDVPDVFVRDRETGLIERVSVGSDGAEGNSSSFIPSISANGRFVAFASGASNFAAADTNRANDIFVHDRQARTTERVSEAWAAAQMEGGGVNNGNRALSADGNIAVFFSFDSRLIGDTNGLADVFVHDRLGIPRR